MSCWPSPTSPILGAIRAQAATAASEALQRPVTIDRLSLRAIPSPGVQIEGLGITEKDGAPIVTVDQIITEVKLAPLFQRKLVVDRIIVNRPRLTLTRNPDGSLNLPLPPPSAKPPPPGPPTGDGASPLTLALEETRVENGEVTIRERRQQSGPPLLRLEKLNIALNDVSVHGKTPDDFKRSLTGTARLEVKEGSIGKMETLGKILSILNVKRMLSGKTPDLSREGITIDSLGGHVQVQERPHDHRRPETSERRP